MKQDKPKEMQWDKIRYKMRRDKEKQDKTKWDEIRWGKTRDNNEMS